MAYIVDRIGRFVNSTVQQFGDAKLLYVSSYFIGGSAQDVIRLRKEKRVKKLFYYFIIHSVCHFFFIDNTISVHLKGVLDFFKSNKKL